MWCSQWVIIFNRTAQALKVHELFESLHKTRKLTILKKPTSSFHVLHSKLCAFDLDIRSQYPPRLQLTLQFVTNRSHSIGIPHSGIREFARHWLDLLLISTTQNVWKPVFSCLLLSGSPALPSLPSLDTAFQLPRDHWPAVQRQRNY